ncbi:hypothetical protein ACFPA8_10645 [Streptomyces ovatisporus]|uniref:Phenazine biosynthesis PhzC/PhzF protein n=1 Tax=Streptomyces ovatisporus TaxID=1128682 RepID=A0ABV9A4E4_9ACTN
MQVTSVAMFGTAPGHGSALDVLLPDGPCDDQALAHAAAHARTTDTTVESALVSDISEAEQTFESRIFNTGGETPFATHSLAGVAAFLVSRGHLRAGEVGRRTEEGCQWLWTDGRAVEVPFTGPVVDHGIPADPALFGPYDGTPRVSGVGRGFTFLHVTDDPRALPAPDTVRMAELGMTDLTLFRWDPEEREVLARVFAPGFGLPQDPGCLPAAAALGLMSLFLTGDGSTPVTVRQVIPHGTESVLRCTGSVRGGAAQVQVTSQVWVDEEDTDSDREVSER